MLTHSLTHSNCANCDKVYQRILMRWMLILPCMARLVHRAALRGRGWGRTGVGGPGMVARLFPMDPITDIFFIF